MKDRNNHYDFKSPSDQWLTFTGFLRMLGITILMLALFLEFRKIAIDSHVVHPYQQRSPAMTVNHARLLTTEYNNNGDSNGY